MNAQTQPQRVRIAVLFDRISLMRTGLRIGRTFPVVGVEDAPREGHVWVECPPVDDDREGANCIRTPGFVLLKPNEYEVVN
jgi:hypothetical protein